MTATMPNTPGCCEPPVRVLHVVSELRPKTDTKWLLGLARAWHRSGRVRMSLAWCYGPGVLADAFADLSVRCWPLEAAGPGSPLAAARLRSIAREGRSQLLHSHLLRADLLAGIVGRAVGLPVLRTAYAIRPYHRQEVRPLVDGLLDVLEVRLPNRILAVCEAVRRDCIRRGARPEKVAVVHTAGPEPVAVSPEQKRRFRAQLGCHQEDLLVLTVARLSREKGIEDLVAAARLLASRWPNLKVLILGDGPLRESLQTLIRVSGLQGRFLLAGWRDDVHVAMAACDVFCLPSRMEGLPNALLEAMAAGCPIVATAVGGVPEIVQDGATGLLVRPGQPGQLAGSISQLLSDKRLRSRLGRDARCASRRYPVEAAADAYACLYEDILTHR